MTRLSQFNTVLTDLGFTRTVVDLIYHGLVNTIEFHRGSVINTLAEYENPPNSYYSYSYYHPDEDTMDRWRGEEKLLTDIEATGLLDIESPAGELADGKSSSCNSATLSCLC